MALYFKQEKYTKSVQSFFLLLDYFFLSLSQKRYTMKIIDLATSKTANNQVKGTIKSDLKFTSKVKSTNFR